MTTAPTYNRLYNFTNFQAVNPLTPLPASQVDAELSQIKITLDAILQNLALIQKSDGSLANGIVGPQQLSTTGALGFNFRGSWLPGASYVPGDTVFYGSVFYAATSNITSATPPGSDATHWLIVVDFSAALATPITAYFAGLPAYTGSGAAPVQAGNLFWNNGILEKAQ